MEALLRSHPSFSLIFLVVVTHQVKQRMNDVKSHLFIHRKGATRSTEVLGNGRTNEDLTEDPGSCPANIRRAVHQTVHGKAHAVCRRGISKVTGVNLTTGLLRDKVNPDLIGDLALIGHDHGSKRSHGVLIDEDILLVIEEMNVHEEKKSAARALPRRKISYDVGVLGRPNTFVLTPSTQRPSLRKTATRSKRFRTLRFFPPLPPFP
jgi:hypothetical protein